MIPYQFHQYSIEIGSPISKSAVIYEHRSSTLSNREFLLFLKISWIYLSTKTEILTFRLRAFAPSDFDFFFLAILQNAFIRY